MADSIIIKPEKRRHIFLDIDGVLNHSKTSERYLGYNGIDPHNVIWLNRIADVTKAVVVVSSTWRYAFGQAETIEELYHAGFRHAVVGFTPDIGRPRGEEIQAYCELYRIDGDNMIILDDDDDTAPYKHRHVQTGFTSGGLRQEHFQHALQLFGI